MGFNPRDAVTWDGLGMFAMTAWSGDRLVGAIPLEPRSLRISADETIPSLHETVVAVDPDRRGEGLGSLLQKAVAEERRDNMDGSTARLVTVFREDPHSATYRWYLKNGFSPVMRIVSWLCDQPASIASSGRCRAWKADEIALPWGDVEQAWSGSFQSRAGGIVDRGSRRLREWLAIHPYRLRYAFHVVADGVGGFAVLGIGTMHSRTIRADVLELLPACGDCESATTLIRAVAAVAMQNEWRPIRLPAAGSDPITATVQSLGFQPDWTFDALARAIGNNRIPDAGNWRYAGIDYI